MNFYSIIFISLFGYQLQVECKPTSHHHTPIILRLTRSTNEGCDRKISLSPGQAVNMTKRENQESCRYFINAESDLMFQCPNQSFSHSSNNKDCMLTKSFKNGIYTEKCIPKMGVLDTGSHKTILKYNGSDQSNISYTCFVRAKWKLSSNKDFAEVLLNMHDVIFRLVSAGIFPFKDENVSGLDLVNEGYDLLIQDENDGTLFHFENRNLGPIDVDSLFGSDIKIPADEKSLNDGSKFLDKEREKLINALKLNGLNPIKPTLKYMQELAKTLETKDAYPMNPKQGEQLQKEHFTLSTKEQLILREHERLHTKHDFLLEKYPNLKKLLQNDELLQNIELFLKNDILKKKKKLAEINQIFLGKDEFLLNQDDELLTQKDISSTNDELFWQQDNKMQNNYNSLSGHYSHLKPIILPNGISLSNQIETLPSRDEILTNQYEKLLRENRLIPRMNAYYPPFISPVAFIPMMFPMPIQFSNPPFFPGYSALPTYNIEHTLG